MLLRRAYIWTWQKWNSGDRIQNTIKYKTSQRFPWPNRLLPTLHTKLCLTCRTTFLSHQKGNSVQLGWQLLKIYGFPEKAFNICTNLELPILHPLIFHPHWHLRFGSWSSPNAVRWCGARCCCGFCKQSFTHGWETLLNIWEGIRSCHFGPWVV